jgi:2-amino-4-hydroxy-6-hydroxymethyldihydropteridine diphosphokinase
VIAYVGMGSNLGDRADWLRRGVEGLRAAGMVPTAASSVWESEPVDSPEPLWFLNMVVAARTGREPLEALEILLEVEARCGRKRGEPNAPRTLDLDLLLLGSRRWRDERLVLPHPRMWERRFVLEPLREIAPGLRDPATGRTVEEACRRVRHRSVVFEVGRLSLAGIIRAPSGPWRSASRHEIQIDRR